MFFGFQVGLVQIHGLQHLEEKKNLKSKFELLSKPSHIQIYRRKKFFKPFYLKLNIGIRREGRPKPFYHKTLMAVPRVLQALGII